jgi:hypothetical protein
MFRKVAVNGGGSTESIPAACFRIDIDVKCFSKDDQGLLRETPAFLFCQVVSALSGVPRSKVCGEQKSVRAAALSIGAT